MGSKSGPLAPESDTLPLSHLGHVTWTININFLSPFLRMLHMKFGFNWLEVSEEKMSDFYDNIRACAWENQQCGFRTGLTQTGLHSNRKELEA